MADCKEQIDAREMQVPWDTTLKMWMQWRCGWIYRIDVIGLCGGSPELDIDDKG